MRVITSVLACAIVIFLLYIIYVKQPAGIKLRIISKKINNKNGKESEENIINFVEGIYYYKQHCTISSSSISTTTANYDDEFLPFGCFELTQPLYNKHQNDVVNTVPDLTQLFFLLKNARKTTVKLKLFKIQFDVKSEIWYISMNGKNIAMYVGKSQIDKNTKKNSPPSLVTNGWNIPILNNKNLEVSVFGKPNKILTKIDLSNSNNAASLYNKLRSNTNLDNSPFTNDLKSKPQTILIIAFCTLYWLYIRLNQIPVSRIGISYNSIFQNNEYYRIFTATFAHIAFFHILMNMASLYSIGNVEAIIGPILYFNYTFIMLIGSMLISLGIQHYLIHRRNLEQYREGLAVGFSCILFGWLVVFANTQKVYCPIPILPQLFGKLCFPTWTLIDIGAIDLKLNLGPFVLLGFIQIFLPRASFIGHLSGIVIGIFVSSGIFRFINTTSLMLILIYLYAWYFDYQRQEGESNNNDNDYENNNRVDINKQIKKILIFRFIIALICFWFVSTSLWFEITFNCILLILICMHYVFSNDVLIKSKYEYVLKKLEFVTFYDNCYWLCHFILILKHIDQVPIFYGNFAGLMLYLLCLLGYVGVGFVLNLNIVVVV